MSSGNTFLILIGLAVLAEAAFFAFSFWLARSRHRSGLLWGLIALFLGPVALIVLALMPPADPGEDHEDHAREAHEQRSSRKRSAAHQRRPSNHGGARPRPGSRGEDPAEPMRVTPQMRWRFLTEYDPAVRAAISEVAPLGAAALEELKNAYLMVEDRTMLPLIIARIRERVVTLPRQPDNGPARYEAQHERARANGQHAPIAPHAAPVRSPAPVAHEAPPPAYSNGAYHPRRQAPPAQPAEQRFEAPPPERYAPQNAPRRPDYAPEEQARPIEQARPRRQAQPAAQQEAPAQLDRVRMPGRFEGERERAEASARPRNEAPPQRTRTGVTAADLVGAAYLETYRNIHIFRLRDGRFYIDKHLAVLSLDQAHAAVDFIIQQRGNRG